MTDLPLVSGSNSSSKKDTLSPKPDRTLYKVVINQEEAQPYAIWPALQADTGGWTEVSPLGTKAECHAWINRIEKICGPIPAEQPLERNGRTNAMILRSKHQAMGEIYPSHHTFANVSPFWS